MTTPTWTDREALDAIHQILDETEWSADTALDVADVLSYVGYTISDLAEYADDPPPSTPSL